MKNNIDKLDISDKDNIDSLICVIDMLKQMLKESQAREDFHKHKKFCCKEL